MNELKKLIRANKIYNSVGGAYSMQQFEDAEHFLLKFHDKYGTVCPTTFKNLVK